MAVGRRLAVDGTPQVEALDNAFRRQREVGAHQLLQLRRIELAGAEGIDQHADRLGYADGVGQLDFAAVGKAGGHDVLGDVARHVGRRAVDLCRILAAEGAAAVTAHAAVGVDDDLAAGQAGVAHGAADHKAAGGVDVVLGVLVEQLRGENGLDDVLEDVGAQLFGGDVSRRAAWR